MQQHTTTIVLSAHKADIVSPLPSPQSTPKATRDDGEVKEKKKKSDAHSKSKKKEKKKETQKRLYRLPKQLLRAICEYLTFEEMFVCTCVCKPLARKFYRILTGAKQCSPVEKVDIKLISDPASFADGITFYRILDPTTTNVQLGETDGCKLTMSALRTVHKKTKHHHANTPDIVSNSVRHFEAGQVAYHLKQLEHMIIYNTVNGNELVRVANNWIFFNRSLFVKILDRPINDTSNVEGKDRQKYLVDIILVEANLTRKPKMSLFGKSGPAFVEPFCEISMDNLHMRTSIASQDDPVWNEDCSFIVGKKTSNNLRMTMFDYGKLGRHTKLGTVEISLKNLACDVLHDVWQPVHAPDNEISGKFHVLIYKSPISKKKEVNTRNIGILGYCGPICDSVPIRLEYGDIMLISNSEFYTHIAKLGTLSLWDHIAMVVEIKKELHLFESTPDGVFTTPLSRRLRFYLKGSTLGVRRLTITRTPQMKITLKAFVKEVDGRPYKQNWMDLVRAWKGSHLNEDLSSIFCSELVSAAYKRMGLLGNDIPSNNFLPVDFALPNNPKVKLVLGKLDKIRTIYASPSSSPS